MLVAAPADWSIGDPARIDRLVDTYLQTPAFSTYPWPEDIRRADAIATLTSPYNCFFEVWKAGEFSGVLFLSRVTPKVDATFHFLFTDGDLVGKRQLLINFLGLCFRQMGFHRLTLEVPDGMRLEKFARKVLGFRYEGEERDRHPKLPASFTGDWVPKQGSRRSQAHFDGEVWRDIVCLRLLASEWEAQHGTGREEGDHATIGRNTAGPGRREQDPR